MKTLYVAGFLFGQHERKVLLIRKRKPEWQKGYYNGIGGHIEDGETPINAMAREFREETGVTIKQWDLFARLSGNDFLVWFFRSQDAIDSKSPHSTTRELVTWHDVHCLPRVIPNLRWLIPMAKSTQRHDWPFRIAEQSHSLLMSLGDVSNITRAHP